MRIQFEEKLTGIRTDVLMMSRRAVEMVRLATDSVISSNPSLAHEVIRADDAIDHTEREVMMKAIMLVMQESPVARDLKFLVSTLGVVGELETIADHGVKLARRSLKLGTEFPSTLKVTLSEISDKARAQCSNAMRLYTQYSPELAGAILDSEETLDRDYHAARQKVYELMKDGPAEPSTLVRVVEVFHALEHVGDNAAAIAKRMQMLNQPEPGLAASAAP